MTYKARFYLEAEGNPSPGMPYLSEGDVVELTTGQRFQVVATWHYQGRLMYQTDDFGLVGSSELERVGE